MPTSIQRISILLLGVIVLIWVFHAESSDPEVTVGKAELTPSPQASKTQKKRTRIGPRKPPPAAMGIQPNDGAETDDGLTEQERKLDEYLEYFETLENPNVDELTMLGEMAFEAQENQAAYDHYLEVIDNHSDDPKSAFALYKLAWTEYNLGDVEAAIDDMKLMLEWLEESEGPLQEMLRTAGPDDLALFESKIGH